MLSVFFEIIFSLSLLFEGYRYTTLKLTKNEFKYKKIDSGALRIIHYENILLFLEFTVNLGTITNFTIFFLQNAPNSQWGQMFFCGLKSYPLRLLDGLAPFKIADLS